MERLLVCGFIIAGFDFSDVNPQLLPAHMFPGRDARAWKCGGSSL